MATVAAGNPRGQERRVDRLSGTPRAHALDRWIYVFTAALFIAIVLAGFIPDSLAKISAVRAGQRGPFPLVLHLHAVLMGSFLLLLLAQTVLVATGRCALHRRIGVAGMVLAPALVAVGFVLVPTTYYGVWGAAQAAPAEARASLDGTMRVLENIMLLQLRIGILFPVFIALGLRARGGDAGFHKRMMILATALALPAGIDRIPWLPTTFPVSPLATDLYMLAAVAPMFLWDVVRNRCVHKAYQLWLGVYFVFSLAVYAAWDKPWWHAAAHQLLRV